MIQKQSLSKMQANVGVFLIVYGKSGSGKTSSVRNFPVDQTVIISSEPQGMTALVNFGWSQARVVCPHTSEEFLKAIEECLSDSTVRHIVVDSFSQYSEMLIKEYIDKSCKDPSKMGMDLYRVINLRFQDMYRRLLEALPIGKDVIGLIHMNVKEATRGEEKIVLREIALSGGLPAYVCRLSSFVARAEKIKAGKEFKYLLISDGADGNDGKDLFNITGGQPVDNDLWAVLGKIRERQPVDIKAANIKGYTDLLKLGAKYSVAKPDIDALLEEMKIDVRSSDESVWKKVVEAFSKKYVAF